METKSSSTAHQAGVVTTVAGGGQNQSLGVDDALVIGARVAGDTYGGPLVPEEINHALVELAKRMLE